MRHDAPVLVIDDDTIDVMALQRAFAAEGLSHPLSNARDGHEALEMLRELQDGGGELPGLIILDLRMPGMGGLEFLRERQHHPEFTTIPAVVLSSSALDSDREACHRSGAASYIRKPETQAGYTQLARALHQYWTLCE
ncbi:MAG: response regulator [Nannocystaceae bacterium]|nr:response regulator [bacterium]